ncbi:MAG TPA: hypothetical protein VHQ91_13035 [Geminicoccaceae bacterium]|nr:hypothetical protein [Geminicoccaceae bacterium]
MIKTLILVCLLGTAQPDCTETTADAVIQGPDAMSLVECGMHGQAYVAGGALASYIDDQHYLKVSCTAGRRVPAAGLQQARSAPSLEADQ